MSESRSRRTRTIAPRTIAPRTITRRRVERAMARSRAVGPALDRPRTRADCAAVCRPCPFVSCRYHLFADVTETGGLRLNFPDLEPAALVQSCALDVADAGPLSLDQLGDVLNLTRERARQLEDLALRKVRRLPMMRALRGAQ